MPTTASWLAGSTVAVAGAEYPLGRAVASSFASRRVNLALAGVDGCALGSTAEEVARIRALHQHEAMPLLVEADVATPEGVTSLKQASLASFGPLDAVVHVAEVGDVAMLLAATSTMLAVAGQDLVSRGGSLVVAVLAGPWHGTDRAHHRTEVLDRLRTLVYDAARRWPRQVAVNGVVVQAPPPVRPLGYQGYTGLGRPATAVPQTGTYDEAARIVRFLASREAQALTGQTLTVGGALAEAA
ncbi:MAG: KR domain-containing protein [Bacteroidota bacterium]